MPFSTTLLIYILLHKLSPIEYIQLTEAIDQISLENRKLTSEVVTTRKFEQQVREKDNKFRKKSGERGAV